MSSKGLQQCFKKKSSFEWRWQISMNTYFYINTPINFLWNLTLFILVGETIIRLYNLNLLWNLENVGSMIFIDK